ncbi:hypothetical protein [Bradyrhizobium stylosanthis]|uniref:hypothetical protein n=1 Tax=Bradyrhizobium stylosanthis TaxID=1803665 RepID=UPI0011AA3127|nr:hypothetical protein [Bradyrhizobium stylosanthis]
MDFATVVMKGYSIIRLFHALLVGLLLLVAWGASAGAQQLSLRVKEATLTRTIDNHQALRVQLNEQSKADYAEFTARYVGRRIVFSVQGRPIMNARLMTSVLGGEVQVLVDQISVADELAASLATGKATMNVRVLGE